MDFVPENLGGKNDEEGGRFHQSIKSMEHS